MNNDNDEYRAKGDGQAHRYVSPETIAAHPWPPKHKRRLKSSPATPPEPAPTCEDSTADPIASPAPTSQATAIESFDLSNLSDLFGA